MGQPSMTAGTRVRGLRVTRICLAMLVEGMSSSSINVQVGALDEAFHPNGPELGLVAAAFLVAYAGLLPDAGRLVDVRGRGPIFIAGVTAFALGSLVCAGAGTIWPGRGVPEGPPSSNSSSPRLAVNRPSALRVSIESDYG